jgi:hypothetical protein
MLDADARAAAIATMCSMDVASVALALSPVEVSMVSRRRRLRSRMSSARPRAELSAAAA